MKTRLILSLLLLCAAITSRSEDVATLRPTVSAELYGASGMLGLNFDSRVKAGSPWGYRVGIGYFSPASSCPKIRFDKQDYFVGFPVMVNYLTGKGASHLEGGFGATLGVEHQQYLTPSGMKKYNGFGYWMNVTVGYRYQRASGLMVRAGFNPSFTFSDRHGIDRKWYSLMPYIGVGYTF